MLFNSYVFLLAFLPVTWAGYWLLARIGQPWPTAWLAAASLVFYGAWDTRYLLLLGVSILFNFSMGAAIGRAVSQGRKAGWLLALGVGGDLALLGYYKYAGFFLQSANALTGADFTVLHLVLPLGISFYTFTQIAFLVDVYRGGTREYRFVDYVLFVTYFPHLIAGPILHHAEMMPQFRRTAARPPHLLMNLGLAIFVVGLFKKVVLADRVADYAAAVFDAAARGVPLTAAEAWAGTLAYTLQLYFDFSGYSDMAVGLSLLFGIRLPLNFASPYQATSIIDFWRRWHMTLSRFLRDYLYIPLGGNRHGPVRRYANLLVTMLLGGLWHGAGWTFVIWGGLHGLYLVVNHAWRAATRGAFALPGWTARLLTFVAVMIAWVYFRADSVETAHTILGAMAGAGAGADRHFPNVAMDWRFGLQYMAVLTLIAWFAPSMIRIFGAWSPALDASPFDQPRSRLAWRPSLGWAFSISVLFAIAFLHLSRTTVFLYFQF